MADDNKLGAPTEGLGQKVTFAFNPPNGAPSLSPPGATMVRGGIVGGDAIGGTRATGVQSTDNPLENTFALLARVADPILRKQLEEKKTDAYLMGMQKAMSGEAVADIAKSQPWYSTLFGDSDVVEGARAYASATKAQVMFASMEDKMPDLRKMSPTEAQAYYSQALKGQMTGDRATDLSVTKQFMSGLPAVMRRQTKEHYGYLQENAVVQENQAFMAGATNLQAASKGFANGVTTPDEFKQAVDSFVVSTLPAPGRDEKNYLENRKDNLVAWAQQGNFHALNALKDAGFLNALTTDQRVAVDRATEQGEARLKSKYSFDWIEEVAKINAQATLPDAGMAAKDIKVQMDALNMRYNAMTGSRQGLFSPTEMEAKLSGSMVAITREKRHQAEVAAVNGAKLAAAGDKAAAAAEKGAVIDNALSTGWANAVAMSPGYSREEVNMVAMRKYEQATPQDKVKLLQANYENMGYVIDPIKAIRIGQINKAIGSQSVDEFNKAFQEYANIRSANPQLADAYYGDLAPKLEGFFQDVKNGVAPVGSFQAHFTGPASRSKLSKEEMKAVVGVVNDDYNSLLPAWAGGQKLQPGSNRRIANEISEMTEQFAASTGDTKEAAKRALAAAKSNGLEIVGGYAWRNESKQDTLFNYLTNHAGPTKGMSPIATDKVNDHVSLAVAELLYGDGGVAGILPEKASDTALIRLPDQNGVPQFHVQSVVDGKVYNGLMSAADVYKLAAQRAERAEKNKLTLGKLPPEPDAPSIYAGEKAWADYRARQAAKAAQPK